MNSYIGGKGGAGVFQRIISLMPKHNVYIEGFLGSGRILRNKKPANINVGVEIDKNVLDTFNSSFLDIPNLHLHNESFFNFTSYLAYQFLSNKFKPSETLIYLDPPYLKSVRSCQKQYYKYDLLEDHEHEDLLVKANCLDCMVMISGYDSELYDKFLSDWRKVSFNTSNRAGKKTIETVWMNFREPHELHDYRFLGNNFRERERINRIRQRWQKRLLRMDRYEKLALMQTIEELRLLP